MVDERLLNPEEFKSAMEQIGVERYHSLHPFHHLLHNGELKHGQVQAWALNRYYYQASIPRKDLTLMARLRAPELRCAWRSRVLDHDGYEVEDGGIARYLQLTTALDLDRDYVISTIGILPATPFGRPPPILLLSNLILLPVWKHVAPSSPLLVVLKVARMSTMTPATLMVCPS